MELPGNENRIQALYSELKLEVQSRVPSFNGVWSQATLIEAADRRSPLKMPLLIAFSVVAIACSFTLWSWNRSPASAPTAIVLSQPQTPMVETSDKPNPVKVITARRHHKNSARRRVTERWATTEAAMLSSWQSPTARLMESPTSLVMSSLPQLNESAKELQSFLPANNDIPKE